MWPSIGKDRVYLPQEDLQRFGVGEVQIAAGQMDSAMRELLAFQVARARALLYSQTAWPAFARRVGLEIRTIVAAGDRITAQDRGGGLRRVSCQTQTGGQRMAQILWRSALSSVDV